MASRDTMNSNSRPEITVIVPVFNAATSVLAGLTSVLDHTCAELEVICVDDGSTDGSAQVLEQLAATDRRVSTVRLGSNRGVSHARNEGLERATGAFVGFLDADDTVPAGALDLLLATSIKTESDITIGKVLYLEERGQAVGPVHQGAGADVVVTNMQQSRWLQSVSGHHCGNLYRRRLIEQHRIRFHTDLTLGEDQLFQATAMVKAASIALVEDTVYFYHHYSDASVTKRPPNLKRLCDDLEWQRRTMQLFFDHDLHRAGMAFLEDWSYSITNYWLQIPVALTKADASRFFSSFRAMCQEFGAEPWTASTRAHHRHLLDLVMSGQDERAFSFLATDEAQFGLAERASSA